MSQKASIRRDPPLWFLFLVAVFLPALAGSSPSTALGGVRLDETGLAVRPLDLDHGWRYLPKSADLERPPGAQAPWQPLEVGTREIASLPGWRGCGWFAVDLEVAEGLAGRPLALRVWHPGASEIWIGEDRLAAFGSVASRTAEERTFDPGGEATILVFERPGRHLLRLRYSSLATVDRRFGSWLRAFDPGGYRLAFDLPSRALQDLSGGRTLLVAMNLGVSTLALGFAIFHFLLFGLHRRHGGNLWFGCFAAALAANGVFDTLLTLGHFGLWGKSLLRLGNVALAGGLTLSAVAFAASLRPGRGRGALRGVFSGVLLVLLLDLVPAWRGLTSPVGSALILVSGGIVLWLALGAWRAGVEHVGSLGFSALGWSLVVLTQVGKQTELFGGWGQLAGFGGGILLTLLGGSIFLVRKVATEGRELQFLAQELEARVAERTAELRESERQAQSANRAKSAFLATMSHEIRTPMNAVVGFSELLSKGNLPQEARSMAEMIHRSARSLLRLLDEVLDFSRVEAGQLELLQRPFDVEVMVREAVALFIVEAEQRGLALRLRLAPEVPRRVLGDGARIRQVLVNLLGNAIKFTEQGEVELSVDVDDGGRLVFGIRDTGIGIPPEKLERLFQPFFQVDGSSTRRFGGAGLGLTISRQLTHAMGGTIEVRSEAGKGTRFTVLLPLAAAMEEKAPQPAGPVVVGERESLCILLAEDNVINQVVTEMMLKELGHRVELVDRGGAVLEALEAASYDVILLDLHMPDMDGIEVARQLRRSGVSAPLVALTASVLDEDRERSRAAGMDAFLAKPVSLDELQRVLDVVARAGSVRAGSR